jgi:putative ATP-dependent endonuclease of OLD family
MAKIRHIKIENFRAIKSFEWWPNPGVNCLIGPGDVGKSTVINAIDLCLGPRRTKEFADSDFHKLNTEEPILIEITVSDLADTLKNFDKYDLFLRGYNPEEKKIEDEPGANLEPALTIVLTVGSDLDPQWSLFSERATVAGAERALAWGDRVLLAGTRIDAANNFHLSWRKGSVLDRLSGEKPDTAEKIAEAKRAAREAFSGIADDQLDETLEKVEEIAEALGVSLAIELQALLNAHSISLSGGTIAVHDANGVPLSRLGLGSTRLLVAGLLNEAQDGSDLVLVDELEHGLEPHRIIRFLGVLGAKKEDNSKQAFFTSHSPIVLRELNADQLFVLASGHDGHKALSAAVDEHSQGAVRSQPEAFLAKRVLVCEGASEVGLIRGLELDRTSNGKKSLFGSGLSLINAGGCSRLYERSPTLQALGYECASFRDDDVQPDPDQEELFEVFGGTVFKWQAGQKIEAAIVHGLPATQLLPFVELAVKLHGEALTDQHLKGNSAGALSVATFRADPDGTGISPDNRIQLADACSGKSNPWFKTIGAMESLSESIIAPALDDCDDAFKQVIIEIQAWATDG